MRSHSRLTLFCCSSRNRCHTRLLYSQVVLLNCGFMTTGWLATASGAFAVVVAFWTGTFDIIVSMMATNLYAALFVYSIFALVGVGLYNVAKGRNIASGRYNKRGQWTALAAILIVTIALQPYLIQGTLAADTFDEYTTPPGVADYLDKTDEIGYFTYVNSSGHTVTAAQTEADGENGEVEYTLAATAQDTTKVASLDIPLLTTATIWNVTAFLEATDDSIGAIGIRIGTPTEGKPFVIKLGWEGGGGHYEEFLISERVIFSSDDDVSTLVLSAAQIAEIEDYATPLASENMKLYITEADADEFVSTSVIEVELHFYQALSNATFDQYLFGAGLINILIALGMTRMWNPLRGGGGRRRRRRRRRR